MKKFLPFFLLGICAVIGFAAVTTGPNSGGSGGTTIINNAFPLQADGNANGFGITNLNRLSIGDTNAGGILFSGIESSFTLNTYSVDGFGVQSSFGYDFGVDYYFMNHPLEVTGYIRASTGGQFGGDVEMDGHSINNADMITSVAIEATGGLTVGGTASINNVNNSGSFTKPNGAVAGYVLTTDVDGVGTWQAQSITAYTGSTNIGNLATSLVINIGHTMPSTNYTPSVSFIGGSLGAAVAPSYTALSTTQFTVSLSAGIAGGENFRWSVIYSP